MRNQTQSGEIHDDLFKQNPNLTKKEITRENFNLPQPTVDMLNELSGKKSLSRTVVVRIAIARLYELTKRMPQEGGQIQILDDKGNAYGRPFQFIEIK